MSIADEINQLVAGRTAPTCFLDTVAAHGDVVALRTYGPDGEWQTWTYTQLADRVARAAAGLRAAGVQPGQRVLLMMRNLPDFHWFDIAAQFLRATPVSIYNSSSPEEIQYLADHAEAELAIVEGEGFVSRVEQVRDQLPRLRRVYVLGESADELLDHPPADLAALGADTSPDDIATLIYTSGTTGPPKGVMISQYNVVYTVESLRRCMALDGLAGIRTVSYLPMAHIAERQMGLYQPMVHGYAVHCCPDVAQLSRYLVGVRPEVLFGVPRVWEKIYNGVNAALAADPDKAAKFNEAVTVALAIKDAQRAGTDSDEQRQTWAFLDAVAFSGVRALVGLDALRAAVTGAAPIQQRVLEWYNAIGVPLSEIYGMSESTGPISWSPNANRPGYVGREVPGVTVRLADDGEVLCRGGVVFQGYLKQPDKTAETIDADGWLHTGDIGEIHDGYVKIVDRKKELIITSGGKNISPANLESALRAIPLVGQAAAIGDNRHFCTAILVLDPDAAAVWKKANGLDDVPLADLARRPDVIAQVQAGVDEVNRQFAQVEQIRKFVLVGEEWLPDSDVLTPTSKLKRRGVNARYARQIDEMYASSLERGPV